MGAVRTGGIGVLGRGAATVTAFDLWVLVAHSGDYETVVGRDRAVALAGRCSRDAVCRRFIRRSRRAVMIDFSGDRARALHEVARVLKAHGEFLLLIVNTDWWTFLVSPPMAHPLPALRRALAGYLGGGCARHARIRSSALAAERMLRSPSSLVAGVRTAAATRRA